ncbi:hypothetical cytosolic protein [Syntrophus aciditrophicus SB]|uniref:Hypothetical cytosolic protein n=1 Tax=Syntrophus aciditrophicus (strain SB) TaxID=56780 RepID=Q2LPR9_SYNAS|nr:hypothetical cytosolic protein [Syntrophus aciditrophicus SB]
MDKTGWACRKNSAIEKAEQEKTETRVNRSKGDIEDEDSGYGRGRLYRQSCGEGAGGAGA